MRRSANDLKADIDGEIEKINKYAVHVRSGGEPFFAGVALGRIKFNPAVLGFYRTVSWLYVLYYEMGKVNVKYMMELAKVRFAFPEFDDARKHYEQIRELRTFNEHNLNPDVKRDADLIDNCEIWFVEKCGLPIPDNDLDWERCLTGLLEDSHAFIDLLKKSVLQVMREAEEDKAAILEQWSHRLNRYHPGHAFDPIIAEAAGDLGRELDHDQIVNLRNRYHQKWLSKLEIRRGDYDFASEARRLVDQMLLFEWMNELPITSKDIIQYCDLQTGSHLNFYLAQAFVFYYSGITEPQQLLTRLKETGSAR